MSLENADTNSRSTNIYITEISQTGTNWYKKYSNGFIEQGGLIASGVYGETINFPIKMKDTDYMLMTSKYWPTDDDSSHVNNTYDRTTTGFKILGRGQGNKGWGANAYGHWMVYGRYQ